MQKKNLGRKKKIDLFLKRFKDFSKRDLKVRK